MFADLVGSIPTIFISLIALYGVWNAVQGEVRREAARKQERIELAQAVAEAERFKDECAALAAQNAALEGKLAEAYSQIRGLEKAIHAARGIHVSGGTVNVDGDMVGGNESKDGG